MVSCTLQTTVTPLYKALVQRKESLVELREKQSENEMDVLARAGKLGLDGMPFRQVETWGQCNGSAARGVNCLKPLLGSGMVRNLALDIQ